MSFTPTKPFDDNTFSANAAWMAFERNSYNWPKFWQKVIYKIRKEYDVMEGVEKYLVLPRNPEYQEILDRNETECMKQGFSYAPLPHPYLDVVVFESVEDIDRWARVAARIS